jgi:hypothetical protein
MVSLHPLCKIRIEIEVSTQLSDREIGRLKGKHPARWSYGIGKKQRMNANIGADIEYDRRRLHQFLERILCAGFEYAEIDRKIDAL